MQLYVHTLPILVALPALIIQSRTSYRLLRSYHRLRDLIYPGMCTCLNAFILTKECDGHTVAATFATVVGPNEGFSFSFSLARPKAPAKHCIAALPGLRLGKVLVLSSLTDLHLCGLGCCGLWDVLT